MISESHINRLAGALALDSRFRNSFLINPLKALEEYNAGYARRSGERPIELSEEEEQLVVSLQADSVEEVYQLLDLILENPSKLARQLPSKNPSFIDSAEILQANSSAA